MKYVFNPLAGTLDLIQDVDDTPVDGATTDPISSNWAYDHNARDATALVQGHATATQITKLGGIEAGAEVNNISDDNAATLTNDSMADALHRHSELSASDGTPNPALSVDASGNVGIGTTSPGEKLEISASAPVVKIDAAVGTFVGSDLGSIVFHNRGAYGSILHKAIALRAVGADIYGRADLIFGVSYADGATYPAEIMRIQSTTGNVGIGTPTPAGRLDVSSDSSAAIPVIFRNTNAGGWAGFNFCGSDGGINGSVVYENIGASVFPGTVWIANRGSNIGNDIVFATTYGITERVRITRDGNVGIGAITPTAVLHLKAGTATAGMAPLKLTPGINLTTPEAGTIEFDGTDLFITI